MWLGKAFLKKWHLNSGLNAAKTPVIQRAQGRENLGKIKNEGKGPEAKTQLVYDSRWQARLASMQWVGRTVVAEVGKGQNM